MTAAAAIGAGASPGATTGTVHKAADLHKFAEARAGRPFSPPNTSSSASGAAPRRIPYRSELGDSCLAEISVT